MANFEARRTDWTYLDRKKSMKERKEKNCCKSVQEGEVEYQSDDDML